MPTKTRMTRPKPGRGDKAHTIVKAGLSAVPIVGGPAAELFSALITPPLAKRRDEWMRSIADGLRALEEKIEGFTPKSLQGNEAFVTAVMHATQAAIRNHQKEKLEALRNAVLNIAIGNAPGEDLQLMFLNLIDTLASWHLRVLRFFQDPKVYAQAKGVPYPEGLTKDPSTVVTFRAGEASYDEILAEGQLGAVLEHTFPELQGQRAFYGQIVKDLSARGLIKRESELATTRASAMFTKQTTEMGDQFIAFISSPLPSIGSLNPVRLRNVTPAR